MTSSTSETEEQEIYRVISDALLCLCEQKPNDPVDFLSRKMLELIGDDPSTAIRKKEITENDIEKQNLNENIILSAEKLALSGLGEKFDENYKIIESLSLNTFLIEDLKTEPKEKSARIISKKNSHIFLSDKKIKMLAELDHPNIIKIFKIIEDEDYI